MSTKEEIIQMIKNMPENISTDDIMEKLFERIKIESAMQQIEEGQGVSHDEVKEKFAKWLS